MSLDCLVWYPAAPEPVLAIRPSTSTTTTTTTSSHAVNVASSSTAPALPARTSSGMILNVMTANVDCIPIDEAYFQNVQSLEALQDRLPHMPYDIVSIQELFENIVPPSDPDILSAARQPSVFSRMKAFWMLLRRQGIRFSTHKRRPVAGFHGFGTASQWNPLALDAGLMTYSRFPFISKTFLRFQAQTDAIARGALLCIIRLPNGKDLLHINAHLSPTLTPTASHIRTLQIDQLCDHIQLHHPHLTNSILLTGDLNIEHGSSDRRPQLDMGLCNRLGLERLPRERLPRRSFVGNAREPKEELVDYVLVSEAAGTVEEVRALEREEGAFGDHLPVVARVRLFPDD
ncbi:hypothetical protein HDU96_008821 [Phlyctochytrium bullatum]|nr:hypothetical protein HDU96_008821 [Phlyctochytrium bullatum]